LCAKQQADAGPVASEYCVCFGEFALQAAYYVLFWQVALETAHALLQIGTTPGLICRLRCGGKVNMTAWESSKGH
jgi:hypothetical protein